MKKLLRYMAAIVTGLSFTVTGVAGASSATLDTTGPESRNEVRFENRVRREVENRNEVRVHNDNPQSAYTGDVKVVHNTTAEDAESGMAHNDSLLSTDVVVDNTETAGEVADCACADGDDDFADIYLTGPHSRNTITFRNRNEVMVENKNNLDIRNSNEQHARSGDVYVGGNTTAGGARSGDATNIGTTEVVVDVLN